MSLGKFDKVLVAYFSWSGNTRKIANQIRRQTDGEIFEIVARNGYSTVYQEVVERARHELRSKAMPELKTNLVSVMPFDIVFIGYPNWCNTFPAPVRTFLSSFDFTKKSIVPFCTHGGGGIGNSISDISELCPLANIQNHLSINGYAVSDTNKEVEKWIKLIKHLKFTL